MYNLRYHIASLVAVFLALAIGLVLGTVVVERGYLDQQRNSLVKSLQTDFTGLKKDNADLRVDRDREHAFAVDAEPVLVNGMLKGKTILIVTNAGRDDALSVTRDALHAAGANTVVATFKAKGFGQADSRVASAVSGVVTRTPGLTGAADPVVALLAAEWSRRGAQQPLTDTLRSTGQLSFDGPAQPVQPDGVALLAAFDGQPDPELVSLTASLDKAGIPAVAVETQGMTTGLADAAIGAGVSSVDHVDRPEGALSVVYVLAGRAEGHYGVKPSATALYPKLR